MNNEVKIKFVIKLLEATQNQEVTWTEERSNLESFLNYSSGEVFTTTFNDKKLVLLRNYPFLKLDKTIGNLFSKEMKKFDNSNIAASYINKLKSKDKEFSLLFLDENDNIQGHFENISGLSNIYYVIKGNKDNSNLDEYISSVVGQN